MAAVALTLAAPAGAAGGPPLIAEEAAHAIADEISGAGAVRTVQVLSLHHRMRGSQGYNAAAALIVDRLSDFGLKQVETIALPADGKIFYGTQRSRPAWNAKFAELWEQRQTGDRWVNGERVASWAEQPISLAQDSASGRADTELIDVGAGNSEADYAGKDVRAKLVLVSDQPGAAAALAVTKYGAAGIVSWAQNQKQAWWGEDQSLIRWGHLDTWSDPTFAFMVSPARAAAWRERLRRGETVRLRGRVEAGRTPGEYRIPTAIIPGRDPGREIVYSCHLDHPSPGANDNASGCAGILEVARTLSRLVAEGRLPQPRRTIRFIWPCEVECTISLLNARPEFAARTLATLHLDMIGGDTEKTQSILRVEGAPPSLASFADDVAFAIARWVNAQSLEYADTGAAEWPLTDPEGRKRPLQAKVGGFSEGSDHEVWAEGSWRVPVIYIADWPDRYIHTQRDVPANLDPTKMKRAIFIAAAAGWTLANLDQAQVPAIERAMQAEALEQRAAMLRLIDSFAPADARIVTEQRDLAELAESASLVRFGLRPTRPPRAPWALAGSATGAAAIVYRRKPQPKGPMNGFGYSWLDDHLSQAGLARPALLDRVAPRDGPSYAYEALNLVDGYRSVADIRATLLATAGPVPVDEVANYFAALAKLGLLEPR